MSALSAELRSRPGWWTSYTLPNILAAWTEEALKRRWRVGPKESQIEIILTEHQVGECRLTQATAKPLIANLSG